MKKIIPFLCVILLLFGCSDKKEIKQADSIQIVTSFYPIYIFAINVAEDSPVIKITNMSQPQTGCLHDYQLTTKDMKLLSNADMFFINGAGMENFLDKTVNQYTELLVVDTSKNTILIPIEEDHQHEDHKQEEEQFNSHIWLNISNAVIQVENIKNAFCEIDPQNKALYEENAKKYIQELQNLKKEIDNNSFAAENRKTAVFHEGFDYFADMFGFQIQFGIFTDENEQPTAKQLAEAIEQTKKENIKVFFVGDEKGRKIAQTIANETNAQLYFLDPITWGDMQKDSYIRAMKQNIQIVKEAFLNEHS